MKRDKEPSAHEPPQWTVSRATENCVVSLARVRVPIRGGAEFGPVDWDIQRGDRIFLITPSNRAFTAFRDLLCGRLHPISGRIYETGATTVQSDQHLLESINLSRSIGDILLESPLPDYIWLEQRRRAVPVVMEYLNLLLKRSRLPLKHQPQEVLKRFWALRFLASRASLLIGREIFALQDKTVRELLQQRWGEFPGAVIHGAEACHLPGAVHQRVEVTADGAVQIEHFPHPVAPDDLHTASLG